MDTENYWKRRTSRRKVLAGFSALASAPVVASIVGCGGDDDDDDTSGGSTTSGTPQSSNTTTAATPKTGGTIQTTIIGDPPTLDPFLNLSYRSQGVASFVYSRLFQIETGPNIEASWWSRR